MKRVCVVGAGPAGLVASKTLDQAGLEVTCYEMSPVVGGHWVIDNPSGQSSAYESLTTNTTKKMSRFSDYEMPEDWPELPTHAHMRRWFESYVDHFGFRDRIRTAHKVIAATPNPSGGWRISVRTETGTVEEDFDALIAASGSYWDRRMPELAGSFAGDILHAQQYRSPQTPIDMQDKNVVVIGIGNTGCELALEIAKAGARTVHLSARSGAWILPKYRETPDGPVPIGRTAELSHPLDEAPLLFRKLPRALRERLFAAIARVMFKRMFSRDMARLQKAGLPAPPNDPLSKRPTVADNLIGTLESGLVSAHPGVARLDGDEVEFTDGERAPADVIVCATGYRLSYPYLHQSVLDTSGDDAQLFLGLMHPKRHDLFVVGVSRPTGGFWPIAEAHAMFIADLLSGKYRLPNQAKVDAAVESILNRPAFNPALYGLALREERDRGAKRAQEQAE